jgi:hypothetical protein
MQIEPMTCAKHRKPCEAIDLREEKYLCSDCLVSIKGGFKGAPHILPLRYSFSIK